MGEAGYVFCRRRASDWRAANAFLKQSCKCIISTKAQLLNLVLALGLISDMITRHYDGQNVWTVRVEERRLVEEGQTRVLTLE